MNYLLGVLALLLVGCNDTNKGTEKRRGEARAAMFEKCMELAAKMPRQADDDVSDIVSECSSASYYMTNYIQ